jgi:hypothetical protein
MPAWTLEETAPISHGMPKIVGKTATRRSPPRVDAGRALFRQTAIDRRLVDGGRFAAGSG